MDLVRFLKIRAEKYEKKPLLLGEETSISYREFDQINRPHCLRFIKIRRDNG